MTVEEGQHLVRMDAAIGPPQKKQPAPSEACGAMCAEMVWENKLKPQSCVWCECQTPQLMKKQKHWFYRIFS